MWRTWCLCASHADADADADDAREDDVNTTQNTVTYAPRALLGRYPRAMDRPMTLGATLVSFGRWNGRRQQRGRGRVARATVDEDMNEDVSNRGKNGNKSRVVPLSSLSPSSSSSSSSASSTAFASAADEAAPRRLEQSSRMYDDTKRRSRWSGLWDEVELEVSERLWLSDLNSMLTPPWGQFLLSDGSMTRHLKLLTGFDNVKTDILWQGKINVNDACSGPIPQDVRSRICGDDASRCVIFQREVDLCDDNGTPLCYAASWWDEAMADMFIMDKSGAALNKPVWLALADKKTELYRDIRRVYLGQSTILSNKWNVDGPFWARHYIFWRDNKPLCVIYEVMNPALELYLGPSARQSRDASARARRPGDFSI